MFSVVLCVCVVVVVVFINNNINKEVVSSIVIIIAYYRGDRKSIFDTRIDFQFWAFSCWKPNPSAFKMGVDDKTMYSAMYIHMID